jgi:hypothetical protein
VRRQLAGADGFIRRGGSHFFSTDRVETVLHLAIGADPDRVYRAGRLRCAYREG